MPIILVIVGIILSLVLGAWYMMPNDTAEDRTNTEAAQEENTEQPAVENEVVPSTIKLPNGSYEAEGSYTGSDDTEHTIALTLSVEENMVTDSLVSFDGLPVGEFTNDEQENFYNSYTSEVIGQPLDAISLSIVGGVTLPSEGFNAALAKIIAQTQEESI